MAESCCHRRELAPTTIKPPSSEDYDIVSAAKAHAANIRRTLWLKEYKRAHCRAFVAGDGTAKEGSSNGKFDVGPRELPPAIDGPIYTPSYWREWQRRSKAREHDGNNSSSSSGGNITQRAGDSERNSAKQAIQGIHKTRQPPVHTGRQGSSPGRPHRRTPQGGSSSSPPHNARPALPLKAYSTPTSSFAGGRSGTPIFESIPGGGDVLLRAHHDAIVGDRSLLGAGRCSASKSQGVRLSHSDPRPKDRGHENSAGGMYDIRRADLLVRPATTSCSFGGGKTSGSDLAATGTSRSTPGAIYNPTIGGGSGRSATALAARFSPNDRFSVRSAVFATPGPGHYSPGGEEEVNRRAAGAVAWTGADTFMDSDWCRPVPPSYLRSWRGFGNGCNVDEHIGYGACLDGLCCTRHSVEKRNALRVVQFRRPSGKRTCSRRDSRRHRGSDRLEQNYHLLHSSSSSFPLSQPGKENEGKENEPIVGGSDSVVLAGKARGGRSAGPSLSRDNNKKTTGLLSRCGSTKSAGIGFVSRRSAAATLAGGGTRSSHPRERTPLHFASERGELSLVDRLCNQGDDRNAVDERGYTPLHDAADKGNTRVVSRLLQEEEDTMRTPAAMTAVSLEGSRPTPAADVDAQDNQGRTALYLACLRGHERIVRALLKAGADPDLVDIRGKPAQEVAGQQKIYQLLQFKADVSLVKANIAALEERKQGADRLRQDAARASAQNELEGFKREESRLRALIVAAERKRCVYAAATESSR